MGETEARPALRVAVFVATSVDGFIAREDGTIDWLLALNRRMPAGEDCGYAAFSAGIDALVMGRHSFEQALAFDPWPYAGQRVVVLSRRGVRVPDTLRATVETSDEAPRALLDRLAREGARRLYLDGGVAVQGFLREGLVDEITVTTVPVLLGRGRPLWGALDADQPLELREVRHWPFGFVQCRYAVPRR